MHDRDGKDTFCLSRAAMLPRWFDPTSLSKGSLKQVRDWPSEQSISARKSPLLHKQPGIDTQVADRIHAVIVNLQLDFV